MIKALTLLAIVALSHGDDNYETVSRDLDQQQLLTRSRPQARIVNGFEATARQFPYQALVLITERGQAPFPCGGSLLSASWVLSASHCLYQAESAQVQFGSIYKNFMPITRDVSQFVRPSTFNLSTLKDDITLLKLRLPVRFTSNVQAIQLPTRSEANTTYLDTILTVSGFGKTTTSEESQVLLYTDVKGISNNDCESLFGPLVTMKILCTRGYPNITQGSCTGDSGGPLALRPNNTKPTLVGMVSFVSGRGCDVGDPQGFTRIGSYLEWISNVTNIALRN